ncbi:KinB-signaling pathway activation protein [Brevibacillus ginsengisoli]|uniref:KinB-signaling pathway activation protein n=1 Tax=Brevibacillus ginsengisoli TaxID=363854 RepID=UPI003CF53567
MNLRKYGWLFYTTLGIGGLGGMLAGFLVGRNELFSGTINNMLMGTLTNLLLGILISVLSQMGFFAYMTFNYLGLSFFGKNLSAWKSIQLFFILFAFFDMVYLRYSLGTRGDTFLPYFVEPVLLLFVSLIVMYAKVKQTNSQAAIPTLFFMFVVTILEWIPGLKQDNIYSIQFMIVPLLFCNVWQVMQLHRLTKKQS